MQERLQKILRGGDCFAEACGVVDSSGQVRVNGVVVRELGQADLAWTRLSGGEVGWGGERKVYLLLHKPRSGFVFADPEGRKICGIFCADFRSGFIPWGIWSTRRRDCVV